MNVNNNTEVTQLLSFRSFIDSVQRKSVQQVLHVHLIKRMEVVSANSVQYPDNWYDLATLYDFNFLLHDILFGRNSFMNHPNSFIVDCTAAVFRKNYAKRFKTGSNWDQRKIGQFVRNLAILFHLN